MMTDAQANALLTERFYRIWQDDSVHMIVDVGFIHEEYEFKEWDDAESTS